MPLTIVRGATGPEVLVAPDGVARTFTVFELLVIEADQVEVSRLQSFFNRLNAFAFENGLLMFVRVRRLLRARPSFAPGTPPRAERYFDEMDL